MVWYGVLQLLLWLLLLPPLFLSLSPSRYNTNIRPQVHDGTVLTFLALAMRLDNQAGVCEGRGGGGGGDGPYIPSQLV